MNREADIQLIIVSLSLTGNAFNILVVDLLSYRKHTFTSYGNDSDPSGISGESSFFFMPHLQCIEKMRA